MAKADDAELLEVAGRTVRVSSPGKPYFTRGVKLTKLDIVHYFLSVAPGALRGIVDRPVVLKRFVNGAEAEPFYQKRAPERPAGVDADGDAVVPFRADRGRSGGR